MKQLKTLIISSYLSMTCLLIVNCSSPAIQLQGDALSHKLLKITLNTDQLPLIAYIKHPIPSKDAPVYIYLEGDGNPWDKGYWPASDPNTHQSVVLPLLNSINRNSLYLARPCYGWEKMPTNCNPSLWTSARYSARVVEMLNRAIDQYKEIYQSNHYIIIGHSGGGTLAMLLGAQRSDVIAIVTIAGNLDHTAWTSYFGYQPLKDSLTIPDESNFPKAQIHWHLIGGKDKIIPASIQNAAANKNPNAKIMLYPEFTHSCCWKNIWPQFVPLLEQSLFVRSQ